MLKTTALSARAYEVTVASPVTADDLRACLDQLETILAATPQIDILTDVRGPTQLTPTMFLEEMRHLPLIFRMIRAIERVAVVADEGWIRAIANVERHLIPGVEYEVFTREEIDHARAWVLRQADAPHPSA
jgi:hypothetical protein